MSYIIRFPGAVDELRRLGDKIKTLDHMRARIEELEHAKYSIGSSTSASSPLPGGGSRHEDKMGSMIAKCEAAGVEYAVMYRSCVAPMAALDTIGGDDKKVLEMCFINRSRGWEIRASNMLHLSIQRIYQIKDRALRRYAEIRGYAE